MLLLRLASKPYVPPSLAPEPVSYTHLYLELMQDNTAVLNATGGVTINGNVTVNGSIKSSGDMVAGSISVQHHTHPGVETGGGSTGQPQ